MPNRLPISVTIIARNEADRIHLPIESVRDWVDEVFVVDSGSEDDTVAIAEGLGARAAYNEWRGYGPQKIYAERAARNDWVLNLDADEEVGPELRDAIEKAFAGGAPDCAAFRFHWKMVHFADDVPRRLAPKKSFIRLYDRRRAGFRDSLVHDSVIVHDGAVRDLPGLVHHRSFRSLDHFRDKLHEYAGLQARDMRERNRKPPVARIVAEPTLAFVKAYLFRRYWIYGADGWEMARLYAGARHARLAAARALFHKENG